MGPYDPIKHYELHYRPIEDEVNHPTHYNQGILEVIDAMKAMTDDEYRGFLRGNALKYIYRLGSKDNPKQDGEKAKYYIDWLIKSYEGDTTK
ncbi:DUF3310 domain-containing protein [Companilactobacillus mishanensis]|uniref:DUF3310 domain-containing protein n=1 Tax=Companilactobacillus mishanensis TaxID=2486008 RepID=A0A5P0ZGK0_9LACO|nr:DUF3310 domain-containing protein [Companilactobacillus mishanensis]MQS52154.1 DUF3310 domain-containing protein [Companilactobacillus mishanensis]